MSVETTAPDPLDDILYEALDAQPSYFRIFFAAINSNQNLVYKDQLSSNGPFPDTFTPLTSMSFDATPLQASTTMDGYVSILASQKGTQHLMYIAENRDTNATNRFDGPVDLGVPPSVSGFQETALINGLNGLPNVFGTSANSDGAIWWKYMNPYGTESITETVTPPGTDTPIEITVDVAVPPTEPWSNWVQIPGSLSSIVAAQNGDGRLIIGGLNTNQRPYINMQSSEDPEKPEGWIGWQDISGYVGDLEQLEIAIDGNALVHIFGRVGTNIYMRVQTATGADSFTDWILFAVFEHSLVDFAVSMNSEGGLYLTVQAGTGPGSPICAIHQTGPALSEWTNPKVIAFAESDCEYLLQANSNTMLSLFARSIGTNIVEYTTELRPNLWQAGWTRIGTDLTSMAITQDVTVSHSSDE